MPIEYDANGRDANGAACCDLCKYPYRGVACDNPGCDANPSIPESTKAARREARRVKAEQDARWQADRNLKDRAWKAYQADLAARR